MISLSGLTSHIDLICRASEDITHFDNVQGMAVVISGSQITRSQQQRHTGFILRDEQNQLHLLHLGWHNCCTKEPPQSSYAWSECQFLSQRNQKAFADWLLTVWEENGENIPYSILYDGESEYFVPTGKLIKTEDGDGLTCATFVLECFKAYFSFKLLDRDGWPNDRPDDQLWRPHILKKLRKYPHGATEEHLAAQEENADLCVRFRPEEVVAGAHLFDGQHIKFEVAELSGLNVVEQMKAAGLL